MPESTSLSSLGLEPAAILTYETLVSLGRAQVATLMEKTTLSRQGVYDALTILMAKELVEYEKQGRNAWYMPVHPSKLYGLIEEQKQITAIKLREAEEGIRLLTASFNLTAHKPGVRYFEGKEGMLEVLEDSLSSPEAIYTYADIEAIVKYIDVENKSYVVQRDAHNIAKRAIIADTPFARTYLKDYHQATTDIRFIGDAIKPFGNVMQIYDNKISYITLTDKSLNGIIIQDPQIYHMHRAMFEYLWNTLEQSSLPETPRQPAGRNQPLAEKREDNKLPKIKNVSEEVPSSDTTAEVPKKSMFDIPDEIINKTKGVVKKEKSSDSPDVPITSNL